MDCCALSYKLSASSRSIKFLSDNPSLPKVWKSPALNAVPSITAPDLASEAFNSITSHPISFAKAIAAEVLPQPGGPERITPFLTIFSPHEPAHDFKSLITFVLPIISDRLLGLYFSAQDSIIHLASL